MARNMTSTSFNVGLGETPRSSSRVLRPPGGGHTDIFGGEAEPPRGRRQAPQAQSQSNSSIGQVDEPKPTNGTALPRENGQSAPQPAESPVEPPAEVAAQQRSPVKEAPATTPTEAPKAEAPKRVRVPPGGFSSGLW